MIVENGIDVTFDGCDAAAQRMGRDAFYRSYRLRIAKVEREYGFDRDE